jgi:hypothetical protein
MSVMCRAPSTTDQHRTLPRPKFVPVHAACRSDLDELDTARVLLPERVHLERDLDVPVHDGQREASADERRRAELDRQALVQPALRAREVLLAEDRNLHVDIHGRRKVPAHHGRHLSLSAAGSQRRRRKREEGESLRGAGQDPTR